MKRLSRASLALVFAFTLVSAFAADSGSIHGTITDPLGAVVPNATVQLLQIEFLPFPPKIPAT